MEFQSLSEFKPIDGVFVARQKRSAKMRDAFIESGMDHLNRTRFSDLKVSDLSADIGTSVGSFYSRFEDKEAFFRVLRFTAVHMSEAEIIQRASTEVLSSLAPGEALDKIVDLMADIFSGQIRGVLRESLLRILEPDDPWAPMRKLAREIIQNMHHGIGPKVEMTPTEARTRLSFCFQMVAGVLQNDLVNDYHVYSNRDDSLRRGLKETLRKYMNLPAN